MRFRVSCGLLVLSLVGGRVDAAGGEPVDVPAAAMLVTGDVSQHPTGRRPPYSYRAWTTADGLPQNSITAIVQTRDGYLWLATYGGLVRFDGVEFTVFDIASNDGLRSNRILSLFEDGEGVLWIGHELEGLTRYKAGLFHSYDRKDGLPPQSVLAIEEDEEGNLWVGTDDGLARFRGDVFETFTVEDGLPSPRVKALLSDGRGTLWIGTAGGLARYAEGRLNTEQISDEQGVGVLSLAVDSENRGIWLETEDAVGRYSQALFEPLLEDRPRPRARGGTFATSRHGALWIVADWQTGLLRLEDGSDRGSVSLSIDAPIATIFVDQEGSLWVGTVGKGLFQLQRQPVTRFTTADGLPASEVRAITGDGDGGLWMAFDCEGTSPLIRWQDGAVTSYPELSDGESPVCVTSLLLDRSGALWAAVGTDLVRYREGLFTRYPLLGDSQVGDLLKKKLINALFEDRESGLWVGTEGYGLFRLHQGELTTLSRRDGLLSDSVHFIMQDREGALWIGTKDGVNRYREGRFESYTSEDGLSPGMVRSIHEDLDGMLWIGTYGGGLSRLEGGEITRYTMADGLSDNVVSRILEDRRGNLWMLGNLGLSFVQRSALNAFAVGDRYALTGVSFGRAEGMIEGSGGRQPAGWQADDGKMWFPTIDGVAVIDARNFQSNEIPPPMVIQRVLVNGREVGAAATIEVSPGARDFEIHYAGLSFAAPEKMRFKVRMEGYDTNWVDVGPRRVAYYTNLPPGGYTFRVKATNNHGVWSEDGAAINLSIEPFFYEQRWFWGLCSVLLVMLGHSIYRARLETVKARNQRLQAEIRERRQVQTEREAMIEKLEAQNAELERFTYTVSHDLKSPLVTIKGFLGVLEKDAVGGDTERVRDDIGRIRRAADTMAQLLEELLEISRVGRQVNPQEAIEMTELARDAAEIVNGEIQASGAKVVIEDAMPMIRGDRSRLLEVFQNLLDNAVKFRGDLSEPRVDVGTRRTSEEIVYVVRDNGIGIDRQYLEKVFGLFERLDAATPGTGIGLALVKRIVELHGGRIWVESEGLGKGSCFCFTLGTSD